MSSQPPRKTPQSRVWAFWTSLPGVLTGTAALIGAVATLAALVPDDSAPSATAAAPARAAAATTGGSTCFRRYFAGIPGNRVAPVEAGTLGFDVITASQPKGATVGLRFSDSGRSIGAMRFAFYPTNGIFKIESIVDRRCNQMEDYANTTRAGDKHVLLNSDTVRLRLDGDFYDLHANGGTTIRLNFVRVAP